MTMRRCVVCFERFELSAAHFAVTTRGWAYICTSCKTIDNAIRYRRKRLAGHGVVKPFAEQERAIILAALAATSGRITAAAKLLQIGKATMHRKIKAYRKAGTFTIDTSGANILRRELKVLEAQWQGMVKRARILRRREKRKRAFERKLDCAIASVQAERKRIEAARLRKSNNPNGRAIVGA